MMKFSLALTACFMLLAPLSYVSADETVVPQDETAQQQAEYEQWAGQILASLQKQQGKIALPGTGATLTIPDEFYFLSAKDAETVLVDVWGNPPGQNVLGMIFPANMTPFEAESWAVTVEYQQDGYVSDEDAAEIDYQHMLQQMKQDTADVSKERVKQGYEPISLVGWAATPFYDQAAHKLHWAKEIRFGDNEINTLNYNIRVLGRKGVLVLNFIAGMEQLPEINQNLDTVLALAAFDAGATYTDFNPELDQVAAYGLGALVAGKVLAKTGFLALALVFLKKFGVFILLGLGALLRKLFAKKPSSTTPN
ncbi:putative membrane-anchored protein [Rheinheimera pacifica]|uniref:DUF2167 domain-containing protein n=1 Tax=Rheinheimera pacifica TaxID=173990 RepID=UPI00285DAE4E|nr:DUF2167 domain-containing protein [Rheinheimera pacifica]MDR6985288.1 putative membrane-anchored protein [Rheinheimera pacifica]